MADMKKQQAKGRYHDEEDDEEEEDNQESDQEEDPDISLSEFEEAQQKQAKESLKKYSNLRLKQTQKFDDFNKL